MSNNSNGEGFCLFHSKFLVQYSKLFFVFDIQSNSVRLMIGLASLVEQKALPGLFSGRFAVNVGEIESAGLPLNRLGKFSGLGVGGCYRPQAKGIFPIRQLAGAEARFQCLFALPRLSCGAGCPTPAE